MRQLRPTSVAHSRNGRSTSGSSGGERKKTSQTTTPAATAPAAQARTPNSREVYHDAICPLLRRSSWWEIDTDQLPVLGQDLLPVIVIHVRILSMDWHGGQPQVGGHFRQA